ncbi:unnamed protein product [Calypogeia fissa]
MTRILIRRCACQWDGVGRSSRRSGSLAGEESFRDCDSHHHHQLPPPTVITTSTTGIPAARRHRSELIASHRRPSPLPSGLLHSIWRIRSRGVVDFVMIDRAFVARLWKALRSAVHEFKISRMQKRSDKRFYVVEESVVKGEQRRHRFSSSSTSAGYASPLSAGCTQLKRSVRRKAGQAAAAVAACPKVSSLSTKNTNAGWGLIASSSSRRSGNPDDENDTEEDSVTSESAPFDWTRWRKIDIGEFSPEIEIATISSSKSMEDLGSLKWEDDILTPSASTKSAHNLGESSSVAARATGFENRQWENRYRLSNKSPQLLQPVRGKLTTLSSLLRTVSDRYARRTGKLTPLHDKSSRSKNKNSSNKRPVLTQSQSAASWSIQSQESHQQQQQKKNYHRSISASGIVNDVPVKRFDNPFQDFLRQSFAERHSRSVHETDRQR